MHWGCQTPRPCVCCPRAAFGQQYCWIYWCVLKVSQILCWVKTESSASWCVLIFKKKNSARKHTQTTTHTHTHKPADHLACIFFSSLLVVTEIPTFALAKIHQSEDGVRWYNLHVKGLVPPFVAHLLSYSRGSFVKDRRRHMHRSSFFCKVWCEYVYAYKLSQTPVGIRCSCARCIAASFPFVAGPLRRLLPMPTSHTEGTMFWDPGIRPKAPSWEEFAILTCQWQ